MEILKKEVNGLPFYYCPQMEKLGFVNMFTTRYGGVSFNSKELNFGTSSNDTDENILKNYEIALKYFGITPNEAVKSKQTHSDIVIHVDESFKGEGIIKPQRFFEADGLMTECENMAVLVFFADCVPILLADKEKKVVCAVHSGWRGTQANIVEKAINKMINEKGCSKKNILASIGPAIGSCHFQVQEEIYNDFNKTYCDECIINNDGFCVDLGKIVEKQIQNMDINKENIAFLNKCTSCNEEFYSFRREGEKSGRMSAFIMIKS